MMVCSYFMCCRFHWCGSRVWKARDTRSCGENCGLHSWREHAASGGAAGGTCECCHLRLTDRGLQRVWSPCTLNLSPDIPTLRSQLWVDDPGFNSQHRQETSLFSKISKLGPTWPPIHCVPGVKQPDQKVTTHLYLVPRLRLSGCISLLSLYAFIKIGIHFIRLFFEHCTCKSVR